MGNELDRNVVADLQSLYAEGGIGKRLLDWAADRTNDAAETSIGRLTGKFEISRSEAIKLAHTLVRIGCGEFIVGRRGGKSRIRWRYSLRSMGQAARGCTAELDEIDPSLLEDAGGQDQPQAGEAPPDRGLTIADAKRLLATTFGVAPEAIEITIRA